MKPRPLIAIILFFVLAGLGIAYLFFSGILALLGFQLLFYGFAIAGVAGFYIFTNLHEKQRKEGLRRLARMRGYEYTEKPGEGFLLKLPEFKLLSLGYRRKASNVIKLKHGGFRWTVFDFKYTTGGGKSSSTHKHTVAIAELLKPAPHFSFMKKFWMAWTLGLLRGSAVEFDDVVFSKAYRVRSQEPEKAKGVFTPSFKQALLSSKFSLTGEVLESSFLVFRNAKRPKPEDLTQFLDECSRLAKAL
jgi:hypothetical protein